MNYSLLLDLFIKNKNIYLLKRKNIGVINKAKSNLQGKNVLIKFDIKLKIVKEINAISLNFFFLEYLMIHELKISLSKYNSLKIVL